jgi:ParB family chromosome partitioning protein
MTSPRDKFKSTRISETRPAAAEDKPPVSADDQPPAAADDKNGKYALVDVNEIKLDPNQPRKFFDPVKQEEIDRSVKTRGVLQPLLVRIGADDTIILVAGERRLRAAKAAVMAKVPVIITTGNPAEISLIENLQRDNLRPVETAMGIQRMIEEQNYTQEAVTAVLGKSRSTVSQILSLTRLPEAIKKRTMESDTDSYPLRLLVAIAKVDDPTKMADLLDKYDNNILGTDDIIKAVRKPKLKSRASSADPAVMNKRINAFYKYVERNVRLNNIKDIWDALARLSKKLELTLAMEDTEGAAPE